MSKITSNCFLPHVQWEISEGNASSIGAEIIGFLSSTLTSYMDERVPVISRLRRQQGSVSEASNASLPLPVSPTHNWSKRRALKRQLSFSARPTPK